MKWGEYDLNWGRPLKSILSVFDKKVINFNFIIYLLQIQLTLIKILRKKKEFLKILNRMKNILKNKEYLLIKIKERN